MAYPHRIFRSDRFYRIRNYCCEGQPFFRHTPETRRLTTDLLCKYATKRNVGVVGFVFMPAYFEMIVVGPELNLDDFMQDFQGQLARGLGEFWGRSGPFFVGRYEDSEIEPESLVDAYLEMMCLPVSENYVEHPAKWPGVTSWEATQSGGSLVGARQNREEYWKQRRRKRNNDQSDAEIEALVTEHFALDLVKLPAWKELEQAEYAKRVDAKVAEKIEHLRAFNTRALSGVGRIAEHPCDVRPGVFGRRMPACTTCSVAAQAEYCQARKAAVKVYRKAASRLRRGWKKAYFPAGMFPPGHLHAVGSPGARAAGEARGAPAVVRANRSRANGDATGT